MSRIFAPLVCLSLVGAALLVAPAAARAEEPKEPTEVDKSFDLYWAKRRQIRTIQKRIYLKEGRWELTLEGGIIPNDDFRLYFPAGLKFSHFLSEDVGIELSGAYIFNTSSDLKSFLESEGIDVTLPQALKWRAALSGLWSPFHGKFGLFTTKLFHVDFSLIFGVGAIGTEVTDGKSTKGKVDVGAHLGVGFRVWMERNWALRIEYRHYIYAADGGGVSYPAELTLGISYLFGGPEG